MNKTMGIKTKKCKCADPIIRGEENNLYCLSCGKPHEGKHMMVINYLKSKWHFRPIKEVYEMVEIVKNNPQETATRLIMAILSDAQNRMHRSTAKVIVKIITNNF